MATDNKIAWRNLAVLYGFLFIFIGCIFAIVIIYDYSVREIYFRGLNGVLAGKWQKIEKDNSWNTDFLDITLDFTEKSVEINNHNSREVGKYFVKDDLISFTDSVRNLNVYGLEFLSNNEIVLRPEAEVQGWHFNKLSGRWKRISLPPSRNSTPQDSNPMADAKKQVHKIELKLAKLEAIQKAAFADRDDLVARLRSVGVNAAVDLKGNIRGQRIAENIAKLATEIGARDRQLTLIDGEILKAKSLVRRMEQEQAGISEDEMRKLALQLREAEERTDGPSLPITPIDVNAAVENALRVMEKATVRQDPSSMDQTTEKQDPKEITNSIGIKLMRIPKGKFMMGSPETEVKRIKNETQHEVTISQNFYMGSTEVTQAQFKKIMGKNPSNFQGVAVAERHPETNLVVNEVDSANHPVEQVSWSDAVEFCQRLSGLPEEKKAGRIYRLPTEPEWEYACRAGSQMAFSFGSDEESLVNFGWYGPNSKGMTHAVGLKKANAWGLYDMHGNVWEWCADCLGEYPKGSATDPRGPEDGSDRVYRGGSWHDYAVLCRSAIRYGDDPSFRRNDLGFRVALSSSGIPK
jgi:formylglycine-generating enzyme required for sulfatase activity